MSEAVVWWNDGAEKNVFVEENNAVKNILGFTGGAKINSDWSAGYTLEMQMRAYRSSANRQTALYNQEGYTDSQYGAVSVTMRKANWYLDSKTYGRITVGRDNDAAVGTGSVNLANPDGFQASGQFMGFANMGMYMRRAGTTGNVGLSAARWFTHAYIPNGDGPVPLDTAHTSGLVKYTSPFFLGQSKTSGFQFQASWGKDDIWATALRYVEDFGTFRLAAAGSYTDSRDLYYTACSNPSTSGSFNGNTSVALTASGQGAAPAANPDILQTATPGAVSNVSCNTIQASASIMHTPTGLYVSGGYARLHDDNRQVALNLTLGGAGVAKADKEDSHWWVQAGWEAKLNTLGKTTFYGTYGEFSRGTGGAVGATDVLNSSQGNAAYMVGSSTTQWGLGVTQAIDAAAMNLYLGYINTSTDMTIANTTGAAAGVARKANAIDDNNILYSGATIKF